MSDEKNISRRRFLQQSALIGAAAGINLPGRLFPFGTGKTAPAFVKSRKELTINRILVQRLPGRRLTPVAPNA